MRLQSPGSHGPGAADDEIFMTFASGGSNEQQNDDAVDRERSGYENPLDDVFGSAPASPTLHHTSQTTGSSDPDATDLLDATAVVAARQDPSDIPRLRSVHVTNGYREGLSASKEQHVQAGFDEGYALGAELGMKVGWLMGVLEGVSKAVGGGGGAPATGSDDGQDGDGRVSRDEARRELVLAEEELAMRRLFGEEFFGGDGVWIYPVPGGEGEGKAEEDVTFKEVAEAHPVVVKWERKVRELAERAGLRIG